MRDCPPRYKGIIKTRGEGTKTPCPSFRERWGGGLPQARAEGDPHPSRSLSSGAHSRHPLAPTSLLGAGKGHRTTLTGRPSATAVEPPRRGARPIPKRVTAEADGQTYRR